MKTLSARQEGVGAVERATTWRSSLWARWLGWTALYALVLWSGCLMVSMSTPLGGMLNAVGWTLILGAIVLTAVIGNRVRSWWWLLAPPVVIILPAFLAPFLGQAYLGAATSAEV